MSIHPRHRSLLAAAFALGAPSARKAKEPKQVKEWLKKKAAFPTATVRLINPKVGEVVRVPGRPPTAYTRDKRGCIRRVPA